MEDILFNQDFMFFLNIKMIFFVRTLNIKELQQIQTFPKSFKIEGSVSNSILQIAKQLLKNLDAK